MYKKIVEQSESGLIAAIIKKWGSAPSRITKRGPRLASHPAVLIGMGDDAAAVFPASRQILLLTTDTLVEGIHFNRSFSTFFHVGHKAITVNVSDIAAMGGRPLYFLVSLGIPDEAVDIHRLYAGIKQEARGMNIEMIGGNITRSGNRFFVSITLIGDIPQKEIITRTGGSPGDSLYVTGTLGDAAAGLEILKTNWAKQSSSVRFLTRRHQTPTARWREGRLLARERIPSAMIDLSDGLSLDLSHLARQSGVGAELNRDQIPISPALARYAKALNRDPIPYALYGGDDYELLFSVPNKKKKRLDALIAQGAICATPIGRLVEKKSGFLIKEHGVARRLKIDGYDHLRGLDGVTKDGHTPSSPQPSP